MKPLPSDYKILKEIYNVYYDDFCNHDSEVNGSKIMWPVDLELIAKNLGVEGNIVFGRLYYYLSERYSYKTGSNSWVRFFSLNSSGKGHCVNFPLLASVLASMKEEQSKFIWATSLSILALFISLASIALNIFNFTV